MSGWWSWVLSIVGITGFILAGRKVWWSWYINLGCQALWLGYALTTKQYGFLIATIVYIFVFGRNALKWTREHRADSEKLAFPQPVTTDIVDLGPECFGDVDGTVISYRGENYYRACSAFVRDLPDGGRSHCVKRVKHPGRVHEDFVGEKRIA